MKVQSRLKSFLHWRATTVAAVVVTLCFTTVGSGVASASPLPALNSEGPSGALPIGPITFGTPSAGATISDGLSTPDSTCVLAEPTISSDGYYIYGGGQLTCTGAVHYMTLNVVVQQYRALGFWATKQTGPTEQLDGSGTVYASVAWQCANGSGNQLYRIVANGFVIDVLGYTASGSNSSAQLRTTCPTGS